MNMTPENHQLIEDLSIANRILYLEGVVDGFGHISARDAQDTTRFWIAKSMAPALVTPSDILQCDLEGVVHDPQNRTCYVERFIHSEIYRARPDVQAIVSRELDAAGAKERADIAVLSQSLRADLTAKGIEFIDVDREKFRAALAKTSFYADWHAKYGDEAWGYLEAAAGKLG